MKTQIRLLLQKQSDLALPCFFRLFGRQVVVEILEHLQYIYNFTSPAEEEFSI